jgi:hypothetical protein
MIPRFRAGRPNQNAGDACGWSQPSEAPKKRLLPPVQIEVFQNVTAEKRKKHDCDKQNGMGKE